MLPIPIRLGNDPQLPYILSAIAGALIFFEGLLFLGSGGVSSDFGLFAGAAIIACAMGLQRRTRYRQALGGAIVGLSLVSFFAVSGFYLGALLGVLGGSMAIAAGGGPFTSTTPSAPSTFDLGPPCPRCGNHIPSWSTKCPYCE
jgi:hypothetical protein